MWSWASIIGASPANLLEMHVLEPTSELLNQRLRGEPSGLCLTGESNATHA